LISGYLVPGAFRIERISSEDLRQMSWQGAGIVHPRAAEIAGEAGIPVEIRRHSSGDAVTRIEPFAIRGGRYITGVAAGPVVSRVRVSLGAWTSLREFYARVFGMVADAGVSMDMFSVMDGTAVFTVPTEHAARVRDMLTAGSFEVDTIEPCSKVSIVGAGMHGMKGVMARFARALDRAGIDMLQTVDSHATISALVRLEQRDEALQTLHAEFLEA
jgi:aspartate kinase